MRQRSTPRSEFHRMIALRPALFSRRKPCTLSTSSRFESRSVRLALAGIVRFFLGYPSRMVAPLYIAKEAAAVCPHPQGQMAVAGLLPCDGMGGSEGVNLTGMARQAAEILHHNDMGEWTRAAPELYPHQWSWDTGFIAVDRKSTRLNSSHANISYAVFCLKK